MQSGSVAQQQTKFCSTFVTGLRVYGKDFRQIQKNKVQKIIISVQQHIIIIKKILPSRPFEFVLHQSVYSSVCSNRGIMFETSVYCSW